MKNYFKVLLLITLLFSFQITKADETRSHDLKCFSHIHKTMAPYHGVPGLRGHMEGYSIQKHPNKDIFFWDSTNKQSKANRTIASEYGYFVCTFSEGLDPNNFTIDERALQKGGPKVLKENRILPRLSGSGVNCRKLSSSEEGGVSQMVMSKYLSLIPEFYQEKLDDIAISIKDRGQRYEAADSVSYISELSNNCTGGILRRTNAPRINSSGIRVGNLFRDEFGVGSSTPGQSGGSRGANATE